MRRTAGVLGSSSAIVLLLALTGCGSQEPHAKVSDPSPSATSPAATSWVALHDEAAGVRFSLPHRVYPQTRPGQDPSLKARLYQDEVGKFGLGVTVVTAPSDIPANYPKTIYDQMVSRLTEQGATNAQLSEVGTPAVAKGEAIDATLAFTATDGSRNYWRMRSITSGHTMVQLQVLVFSDPDDTKARERVDAMFTQLAESVTLD